MLARLDNTQWNAAGINVRTPQGLGASLFPKAAEIWTESGRCEVSPCLRGLSACRINFNEAKRVPRWKWELWKMTDKSVGHFKNIYELTGVNASGGAQAPARNSVWKVSNFRGKQGLTSPRLTPGRIHRQRALCRWPTHWRRLWRRVWMHEEKKERERERERWESWRLCACVLPQVEGEALSPAHAHLCACVPPW